MKNVVKLPTKLVNRRYALVEIKKTKRVACSFEGEWIIDSTAKAINDMIDAKHISYESAQLWISNQYLNFH